MNEEAESWTDRIAYVRERVVGTFAKKETGECTEEDGLETGYARPLGVLSDGRRYAVYRFLLYADGFTPHVGKKGSMGGFYMMPLGIKPEARTSLGAIRRIGLTPPGISTNEALSRIVEDIVKGTANGICTEDCEGNEVLIFLDCVGFIADYPAISETIDVLGHTSNVPCHLCLFQRYDKSGRGGSMYGYTRNIHSGHPAFARHEERMNILRDTSLPEVDLKRLGMENSEKFEKSLHALHELSRALQKVRDKVPHTSDGRPVVPAVFDAYRSSVIAPDHLFLGLAQDVLNCALKHLPLRARKCAEHIAKQSLQENDLVYQNKLINSEEMVVYSMGISAMYSFLLVAPHAMRSSFQISCAEQAMSDSEMRIANMSLELLEQFQKLVSETQYFPAGSIDGIEHVHWYNKRGGKERLEDLRDYANSYIHKLDSLCRISEKAKKSLDKPNVHRLLEFYVFTLPAFGNVRLIQELVLETAHQDMKRGVVKSNHKNSQLQAMEHSIANDWTNRLGIETNDIGHDASGWTDLSYRSVLRLLGRPEWRSSLPDSLKREIRMCFPPPVLNALRKRRRHMASLLATEYGWKATALKGVMVEEEDSSIAIGKKFLAEYIETEFAIGSGGTDRGFQCHIYECSEAKWFVAYGERKETRSTLLTVRRGSVLQSLTCLSEGMRGSDRYSIDIAPHSESVDAKRAFWLVAAIFQPAVHERSTDIDDDLYEGTSYALVLPCCSLEGRLITVSLPMEPRVLIPLTNKVRKVMVLHQCARDGSTCISCTCTESGEHVHSRSLLNGGTYEAVGRREGYPPRRG